MSSNSKLSADLSAKLKAVEVGTLVPMPHGGALSPGNRGSNGGGRPPEAFKRRIRAALTRGKVTAYLRRCLDGEEGAAAYFAALTYSSDRVLGKVPTPVTGADGEPITIVLRSGGT